MRTTLTVHRYRPVPSLRPYSYRASATYSGMVGPLNRRTVLRRWLVGAALALGLLIWIAPAGATSPCGSETVIPASQPGLRSECEAVWAFYTGLDDPGPLDDEANPTAWLPTVPFLEWQGLVVTDGAVRALILPGSGLEGVLSPEIGRLAGLVVLDLSGNSLRGSIPPELDGLTGLESLFLHNNQLSGPLPGELGSLTRLKVLELSENRLSGAIPRRIGQLTALEGLFLHGNRLSGSIPMELGNLSKLERLFLQRNRLVGRIPPELGLLSDLASLDLSMNGLSGPVPAALERLAKLEVLRLHGNRLSVTGLVGPFSPGPLVPAPTPVSGEWPPSPQGGRFSDDNGSLHESNIETIAALGVTLGCNPPQNDRFCPGEVVSRAQMAVLLSRTLGGSSDGTPSGVRVEDAPEDAWYLDDVRRLVALGIVDLPEDGTFRPLDPLTRLEMAVLLARAFPAIVPVAEPAGVFADVPVAWREAGAVEGVLEAGVTTGCSAEPLSYCPFRSVTRDQMATFLVRALRTESDGAGADRLPGSGIQVRMARAGWPSGDFQAALYRALLAELGYQVGEPSERERDPMDAYLGMAEGRIDFWTSGWFPDHDSFLEIRIGDGSRVGDHVTPVGAQMMAGGFQGILVSKAFAETHGIETLDDLNRSPTALAEFDATDANPGNGLADIYGCPVGWPCYDILDSMIDFSTWANIDQVTGPYEAMHAEAVAKLGQGTPILVYAWAPSKHLASFMPGVETVWLGVETVLDDSNPRGTLGGEGFDQRPGTVALGPLMCPAVGDSGSCLLGWRVSDIRVAASVEFLDTHPAVARLLELVRLDPLVVSGRIAMQSRGADVDDLSSRWIAQNRDLVDIWLIQARSAARSASE